MGALGIFDHPWPPERVLPEPTAREREWARAHPGRWLYFVDPTVDRRDLARANVIGGRLADAAGGFAAFWLNPEFVPTARYAGAELTNEVERVLWRVNAGLDPIGRFVETFGRSVVLVVQTPDDALVQRVWPLRPEGDRRVLHVFTSPGKVPAGVDPALLREVSGLDVLDQVCPHAGIRVHINMGGVPDVRVEGSDLARWWGEWCAVPVRPVLETRIQVESYLGWFFGPGQKHAGKTEGSQRAGKTEGSRYRLYPFGIGWLAQEIEGSGLAHVSLVIDTGTGAITVYPSRDARVVVEDYWAARRVGRSPGGRQVYPRTNP
ncbi:hypothetical protein [Nocardia terpenica]|uniref:Uncharacterized protein n=1 Tax=Nocardia terpenica TaxID=455432 RepID=A0A6G9Z0C7_9NOCA|nr:hypothetical protein [Nocardia terpenica]QIS18817.1 hypothetical protein F6W96_11435 [Nocardia terpenica]